MLSNNQFWCVTKSSSPEKLRAFEMIHPNSVSLYFVSDSFFECLKMACQKMPYTLGHKRPIFNRYVSIQRLPDNTVLRLMKHEAELSADNFDDDYSDSYRISHARSLLSIWINRLLSGQKLDFRLPSAGVTVSEVRKWPR